MSSLTKSDGNQAAIVDALRAAGCSVKVLSHVGRGCPDLLVGRRMWQGPRAFLLEVKRPKGKLNPRQERWKADWTGPYAVVTTVEEALRAVDLTP